MQRDRVAIIFGGRSSEYEVSCTSAASVIRAINKEKHELAFVGITRRGKFKRLGETDFETAASLIASDSWEEKSKPFDVFSLPEICDFCLPIVHGQYCEDGKLQGLLDMVGIPYGGCGVLASAVCMDKAIAKDVFEKNGIPVVEWALVTKEELFENENINEKIVCDIEKKLSYPMFVKPANAGSSVGCMKAEDRKVLKDALANASRFDSRILVERCVDCREIETAAMGNETVILGETGEIIPCEEFYDYTAKYCSGDASKLCIPAELSEKERNEIRTLAKKAYKAASCNGFARVDMFIDKVSGKVYLNEINTIPGFTQISMFPKLMAASGMPYSETIDNIIKLGYERYNTENNRETGL